MIFYAYEYNLCYVEESNIVLASSTQYTKCPEFQTVHFFFKQKHM